MYVRGQGAALIIGDDTSDRIRIKRGVKHCCVLSPDLFLLYSQAIMDETENQKDVKV